MGIRHGSEEGELSPAQIDRGWPHQVAVPAKISVGERYKIVHGFCERLSLCSRGHTVIGPDNEWWNVFCFAEKEHAEKFKGDLAANGLILRSEAKDKAGCFGRGDMVLFLEKWSGYRPLSERQATRLA
jgi:hypothetical protein